MKRVAILTIIVFTVIIVLAAISPEHIDWRETYSKVHSIPYGNKVLYTLLGEIFPNQKVEVTTVTLYEALPQYTEIEMSNLLLINNQISFEKQSLHALLDYAAHGNAVFISARFIDSDLIDTLGLELNQSYDNDTIRYRLVGTDNKSYESPYNNFAYTASFSAFDTTTTRILGVRDNGDVQFVRVQFGNGTFYIHTMPTVFSNYTMMDKKKRNYIFGALSHLPVQKTIWDEYYKDIPKINKTSFSVILEDWRLTAAYYVIILGLTVFILINGKRRQRIIPILTPLKNATLDYVQKVGLLYYQHRDSKTIIEKKLLYFHDYLRSRYYLREVKYSAELYAKISAKSSIPFSDVQQMFEQLNALANRIVNEDNDVIKLNTIIEDFKRKAA
ncbi:MAG: DUF4350 domain-containing protein [Candidatus Kapabacteria bacterium]|nr:DUF4350 domain-containing protein [Candidatus Kapabacteria bacterium]